MVDMVDYVTSSANYRVLQPGVGCWAAGLGAQVIMGKDTLDSLVIAPKSEGMTAGALLSLIAHSHSMTIPELLVTAQVSPKKLLCLLKELVKAELIQVKGSGNLNELDGVFAKHESREIDTSEVPYLDDRRDIINELAAQDPQPAVSISRKGFGRALVL